MIFVVPINTDDFTRSVTLYRTQYEDLKFRRDLSVLFLVLHHCVYTLVYVLEATALWKFYDLFGLDFFHKLIGPWGLHLLIVVRLIAPGASHDIPNKFKHH